MVETIKDDAVTALADFDNRARREAVLSDRRSSQTIPVIDFGPYFAGEPGAIIAAGDVIIQRGFQHGAHVL